MKIFFKVAVVQKKTMKAKRIKNPISENTKGKFFKYGSLKIKLFIPYSNSCIAIIAYSHISIKLDRNYKTQNLYKRVVPIV